MTLIISWLIVAPHSAGRLCFRQGRLDNAEPRPTLHYQQCRDSSSSSPAVVGRTSRTCRVVLCFVVLSVGGRSTGLLLFRARVLSSLREHIRFM